MYSKAKIMGHPIHPMLVTFPIAFYVSTFIAFAIYGVSSDPFWFRVGIVANSAGVLMAVVAALFGFIDWYMGIPSGTHAKMTGVKHMLLNVVSLLVFLTCLYLNAGQWSAAAPVMSGAIILPLIGVLLTIGAGYYGWTLVQNHHVGVEFSQDEEICMKDISKYTRHTA